MKTDAWIPEYFSAIYPQLYATDHLTKGQVDGVERMLGLAPGMRILDVCCGYGRHSLELARRGYRRVVGVDFSPPLLARARRTARAEGLRVTFRRADMRRLPFRGSFDAALNLFTSFGYFADEAEDQAALRSMARALRPGGRLLMDLLNREWLVRHFQPRYQEVTALGTVDNNLTFDLATGRLRNVRRFRKDGRRRALAVEFRVYTLAEMVRLLREAGLAFQRAYGNFEGAAYGMDTFRMIVVAEKPVRVFGRSGVR
jgi:SAM-dependent methyltransferase